MAEPSDWKQKYRDSLLEMEGEEKRWRQTEQALRRLIGRLCAAGMGIDPQIDDQLVALAAANRRGADAAELERLAGSLTTAVVAVDAVSPVPTIVIAPAKAARWTATCAAATKLIACLQALGGEEETARAMTAKVTQAATDTELAAVLEQAAGVAQTCSGALEAERLQAAAVLGEVTMRLEEVAGFLTEAGNVSLSRFEDSVSVNDTVMLEVRQLTAEADRATELKVLQSLVTSRLETVTQQVLAFRSREANRHLEQTGRAERMSTRIADLERETQELNFKLDREKHGARLDALTRLGNRKSFDERMALELSRLAPPAPPVILLLWDLDNFKLVNDTYGHRAGDRVLQSVATCFMSGLRAEDFVARIGGEEFVVILSGLAFAQALKIADQLRCGVEALRFHFRGTPVRVTVSCGFTGLREGDTAGSAFDRADAALYRAKNAGKNACIGA